MTFKIDPKRIYTIYSREYSYPDAFADPEPSRYGGLTICYKVISDDTIAFAVAKCHSKEAFNKKEGRKVAIERLNNIISDHTNIINYKIFGDTPTKAMRKLFPREMN